MLDFAAAALAFGVVAVVAVGSWLVSLVRNDVSIVDALWSLMFLSMLTVYFLLTDAGHARAWVILALASVWALRLSVFIACRNHGEPEDYRYREIRRNNEPHFRFKSFYIVFGLQAVLAGVIAVPLLVAVSGTAALGWLDAIGACLWLIGMFFEVVGDHQLARFKADAENRGKVLDTGLWRFTRHPNYFGEFAIWWGYFFFSLAAGGWWTVFSPVLMSFLLLKVSGVALLERSISQRRPEYVEYVRKTNAFFPGPPRVSA